MVSFIIKHKNETFINSLNEPILIIPELNNFDVKNKIELLKGQCLSNVIKLVDSWDHGYTFVMEKDDGKGFIIGKDPIGRYSLLMSFKTKHTITVATSIKEDDDGSYIEIPSGTIMEINLNNDENKFHIKCLSLIDFKYINSVWTKDILNSQFIQPPNVKKFNISKDCVYDEELEGMYADKIGQTLHKVYEDYQIYKEKSITIMFSGGIDSVAISYTVLQNLPIETPLFLINVGVLNDKNVVSTPDRERSIRAYREFKEKFPKNKIIFVCCDLSRDEIEKAKVNFIHKACRPKLTKMDESIALVQHFAFLGKGYNLEDGSEIYCNSNLFLNGSGADEIFGGYMKHRQCYNNTNNYDEIAFCLQKELFYLGERNHGRDSRVIDATRNYLNCLDRKILSPFLTNQFIYFALPIPINMKSNFQKPRGEGEKSILRVYLKRQGLSKEIFSQPKQAMQFGSKIGYYEDSGVKGTDLISCSFSDYDLLAQDYIIKAIEEKWVIV
ncbi:Alternative protein ASNSD1 [Strongyloides ratti]|uniref:Alternative protein ASNSD1 n=1 Tax=Strongyloides ratti TaxID=34506 RepID=A0A090LAZ9_STRRB|nr:Alternative protein ASNSD1 [Strongyloides ratti]CEF66971.1 Alternative protein ASNSD1 [Strongyloides ratti]